MEFLQQVIDLFLHLDVHLQEIIAQFGVLTYIILFLIIFCETGLVVMPFLPGDSLLFAAGAFAARGSFNPFVLFVLLFIAAVLGDSANYAIGSRIGTAVFKRDYRFLNREHLQKAELFYEKHGSKTIIMARFLPIIRTLAPFVAGVSKMNYSKFFLYNIVGGLLWVGGFVFGGFFFGNIPAVEENFTIVILAIIVISFVPGTIEFVRHRLRKAKAAGAEMPIDKSHMPM